MDQLLACVWNLGLVQIEQNGFNQIHACITGWAAPWPFMRWSCPAECDQPLNVGQHFLPILEQSSRFIALLPCQPFGFPQRHVDGLLRRPTLWLFTHSVHNNSEIVPATS